MDILFGYHLLMRFDHREPRLDVPADRHDDLVAGDGDVVESGTGAGEQAVGGGGGFGLGGAGVDGGCAVAGGARRPEATRRARPS